MFAGGAASLGSEIAAARLLAPYFGASTIIWANTIGVVLVALSAGYWFGGRLADRHPDEVSLRKVVTVAAILLALVPLVAGPFLELSVDAFDDIDAGAFIGSLLAVSALIAVPLFLLGAISPWAIRLAVDAVERSGEVAGRLYAVSTLGSLAGVFVSALVTIPLIGTQRTFIVFAAVLGLVATATALPRRALLVPATLGALLALPPGITKPANGDERVLSETESAYQYVRVVERDGVRRLELNEGQAVHSRYEPGKVLTDDYWDGFSVLPFARLDRPPRRVAMLGNAGGTVSRAYEQFFEATRIDGVEIDREVSEAGRRYLGMDNPRLRVFDEDARPFLRRSKGGYDLIALDTYRQPYIPFYLATKEFFELARDRLAPGGAIVINLGHPEGEDGLERTLGATLASTFGTVLRFPIEDTNTLLLASDAPASANRLRAARAWLPAELRPALEDSIAELGPRLSGGSVYTDDKAPVEWLTDASIVSYAADSGE